LYIYHVIGECGLADFLNSSVDSAHRVFQNIC